VRASRRRRSGKAKEGGESTSKAEDRIKESTTTTT